MTTYERSIFKPLPSKFELLGMESETLVSLKGQLRSSCGLEFSLKIQVLNELIRRNKNAL